MHPGEVRIYIIHIHQCLTHASVLLLDEADRGYEYIKILITVNFVVILMI